MAEPSLNDMAPFDARDNMAGVINAQVEPLCDVSRWGASRLQRSDRKCTS